MSAQPLLEVRLLGTAVALSKGRPVGWLQPSHTTWLWLYLLLHAGLPLPREQVAFTLWPDREEREALLALRRSLHRLQGYLPARADSESWLLQDARTVRWQPGADLWL